MQSPAWRHWTPRVRGITAGAAAHTGGGSCGTGTPSSGELCVEQDWLMVVPLTQAVQLTQEVPLAQVVALPQAVPFF